ncbi:hypothetical protein MZK47_16355 [Microbacterium aerolatum]|uniref:hypothetical protein n=1 Tax=Microbacterium aerolatum TaxID=153731 RepID=UPI0020017D3F|nr:hypothetical protein [Microbacterium aerolatum]MCK3771239.1 hypothetical protein [Microbacterium aerolatum]
MTDTTTTAAEILAGFEQSFGGIFERMSWAEDEIAQAQARHPEQADTLFHSFSLLSGGEASARMSVEAVYRAHAREILEWVAAGEDTRPGTAVEVVIGLLAAAERAPLSHEGFGLCARLWIAAGLPDHDEFADKLDHIEALHAARLDAEEADARRACRDDARKLGRIECDGWHHGAQVPCSYIAAA